MQFLAVYIREAHPVDGWWLGGGITGQLTRAIGFTAATDVYDPKTMEEREAVASRCQAELDYKIPMLVDTIDDSVNRVYAAQPTRLYLVGLDGRVVYAGGLGPFGFKPAELGAAIEKYLVQSRQQD
ncbi:MAG: hypothetical protein HYX84_04120 [Chloroflexi bacterium]|nr:hypothetical protein [Chloroflexota bacterium]